MGSRYDVRVRATMEGMLLLINAVRREAGGDGTRERESVCVMVDEQRAKEMAGRGFPQGLEDGLRITVGFFTFSIPFPFVAAASI